MTSSLLITPPAVDRGPTLTPPRLRRVSYEPEPDPDVPPPGRRPVDLHRPGLPRPAGPHPAGPQRALVTQPRRSAPTQPGPAHPAPDRERTAHADAHLAAARFLRLALEVLDGNRPAAHIAGRASPSVLRYWQVATQRRQPRTAARFSRLRLCLPGHGVAEVAVTCEIDGRARALAARFERTRTGWCCTALRLG